MVNELIAELKARGELDNTLVIVSGDHGMPGMPRESVAACSWVLSPFPEASTPIMRTRGKRRNG